MTEKPNACSFTQGYALCSPHGELLGHTYRQTENDTITSLFPVNERGYELWANAQRDGWTVKYVYARIFSPVFFTSKHASEEVVG